MKDRGQRSTHPLKVSFFYIFFLTINPSHHNYNVPVDQLVSAFYHAVLKKKWLSASEMQRVLEIRNYTAAWFMAHKVRKVMAVRDAGCRLVGLTTRDDSYSGLKGTAWV
jgi:hypothetical protein